MSIPAWQPPVLIYDINKDVYFNDFERIERNILHLRNQAAPSGLTTGSNTAYVFSIASIDAYETNLAVSPRFHTANAGACTININGLGPKAIRKASGAELSPGELATGAYALLIYNGVYFQAFAPTVNTQSIEYGFYGVDVGTANAVQVVIADFPGYQEGMRLDVFVANDNTGATTIQINSLALIPLVFSTGLALAGGMLRAGAMISAVYHSGTFYLVSAGSIAEDTGEGMDEVDTYDARNRLETVTYTLNGTTMRTEEYTYDARNRVATRTIVAGGITKVETMNYDSKNRYVGKVTT